MAFWRRTPPTIDVHRVVVLQHVWHASEGFAQAFCVRLSPSKRIRWETCAHDRQLLRQCDGPPVATHFRDLGADQQVGRRREGHLVAERAGAWLRRPSMACACWRMLGVACWTVMLSTFLMALGACSAPAGPHFARGRRRVGGGRGRLVHTARIAGCGPPVVAELLVRARRPVGPAAPLRRSLELVVSVVQGGGAGGQTAPCTELAAARWVVEGSLGQALVVMDCGHVCCGAASTALEHRLLWCVWKPPSLALRAKGRASAIGV